jgi:SAM-dependent methyltransferase
MTSSSATVSDDKPNMLCSAKCPICGNEVGNQTLRFQEKMFRMGGQFNYVDCGRCHAISIIQPPTDLSRYYPKSDYYSNLENSGFRQLLMHLRDLAYIMAYPGAGIVRKYLPNSALETTLLAAGGNQDTRILDVGCGSGALLKSLARLGMRNLTGVDPLIGQDQKVGGIRLLGGELSAVTEQFDVITFHHSLEHVCDPKTVLSQARELLAPEGRIVVRIPTRDSLAYLTYRENWFQIDAPRHICLHSQRSIEIVAEQAGLKITHIDYDSRPMQFWASDLYRDGLPLSSSKARKAYERRHRKFYRDLAQFANRNRIGDQIVVRLVAA